MRPLSCFLRFVFSFFFFFNDTATTEIYTLSLHDALPILLFALDRAVLALRHVLPLGDDDEVVDRRPREVVERPAERSEEHTSELQSLAYLVCRLLLEKKKTHTSLGPH